VIAAVGQLAQMLDQYPRGGDLLIGLVGIVVQAGAHTASEGGQLQPLQRVDAASIRPISRRASAMPFCLG
jgi:hypothetical protein